MIEIKLFRDTIVLLWPVCSNCWCNSVTTWKYVACSDHGAGWLNCILLCSAIGQLSDLMTENICTLKLFECFLLRKNYLFVYRTRKETCSTISCLTSDNSIYANSVERQEVILIFICRKTRNSSKALPRAFAVIPLRCHLYINVVLSCREKPSHSLNLTVVERR